MKPLTRPRRLGKAQPGESGSQETCLRPSKPHDPSRKGEAPMPKLHSLAAVLAASVALAAAAPSIAAPVTVNLRVEGSTQALYEGPVTTDGQTVTIASGGTHKCDGTNQGANPTTGGTPTTSVVDAAKTAGFGYDGQWFADPNNPSEGDFFLTKIGGDDTPSDFSSTWGWWDNGVFGQVGGCQLLVQPNDEVLWAFSKFGAPALRLRAPSKAATGEAFTVTVDQSDGSTGTSPPASNANIAGRSTDASGHATVSFAEAGLHKFKATRSTPDSIRSNAAAICVYAPGSGDCGTDTSSTGPTTDQAGPQTPAAPAAKDLTPPTVSLDSLTPGKTYSPGPGVLAGHAADSGGIAQVFLRLRATDGGSTTAASRCRWFSGKRGVFTHRTVPCSKTRFFRIGSNPKFSYLLPSRLGKGKYVLDVKVLDRSYNAGRLAVSFKVK